MAVSLLLSKMRAQGVPLGQRHPHCRHRNTRETNPTQFTSSRLGCLFTKFHSVFAFLSENSGVLATAVFPSWITKENHQPQSESLSTSGYIKQCEFKLLDNISRIHLSLTWQIFLSFSINISWIVAPQPHDPKEFSSFLYSFFGSGGDL